VNIRTYLTSTSINILCVIKTLVEETCSMSCVEPAVTVKISNQTALLNL
jgi:hypothetical protein